MEDSNTKRKLLRVLSHGSALTSWTVIFIGLPLAVLLLDDDPLVRDSAKEALNFIISQYLWIGIFTALLFTIIGIPAAIIGFVLLAVISAIFPFIAIISVLTDPEKRFRYPLTIRLIPSDRPQLTHDSL
jgi:uncharacterized protein